MSIGRIRRSIVILAKAVGVLLALLVLFVLEENIRGWVGLHLYLHQLRAQGEKLTLAGLDPPKPPKEGNGATALLAAAATLHEMSHTCPLASGPPDAMKLLAPGRAQVLRQQRTLRGLDSQGAWQTYEWEDLSQQLAEGATPLRQVKEALKRPSLNVELDYAQGMWLSLPHLNDTRNIARWLASAALDNIHNGNLDEAVTNIAAIASLTRFQETERLTISQLVRTSVGETGLRTTWEALQAPGWSDSQLARLSEVWGAPHMVSDLVRAVEEERTLALVDFDLLRQRRDLRRHAMGITFDVVWEYDQWVHNASHELPGKIRLLLASELWRLLWSYQDEHRVLHRRQAFLDTTRTVEKRKSWSPVSLPPVTNDCEGRSLRCARFYFSNMLAGPGLEQGFLKILYFETQREMTCAAIAIQRYQIRAGKLPADLAALVPAYLPQLPHDWMNGEPLRYRLNADGTFTLYSVGEDGRDDGGDASFRPDRWGKHLWYCRDVVWPSPASEDLKQ